MSETTQDGPVLGRWWFGVTAEEDAGHRQALLEAADLASRRERNFDQPWWAANVRALLEYVAMLEAAVAAAEQRGARAAMAELCTWVAGQHEGNVARVLLDAAEHIRGSQ